MRLRHTTLQRSVSINQRKNAHKINLSICLNFKTNGQIMHLTLEVLPFFKDRTLEALFESLKGGTPI